MESSFKSLNKFRKHLEGTLIPWEEKKTLQEEHGLQSLLLWPFFCETIQELGLKYDLCSLLSEYIPPILADCLSLG